MKKFRKPLSMLMALIMCLGIFTGMATPAFAASTADVYMVQLPRSADSNKSGWGHPAMSFMNGWATGDSNSFTAKGIGGYESNTAYCIEIGVGLYNGDTLTQKGEDFWDNYPSHLNSTISPAIVKAYIGRIMQYGWTGQNNLDWNSNNAVHAEEMGEMIATQMLIWETVVGERDSGFGHVSAPSGKSNIIDMIASNHPLRSQIYSHYNRIVSEVQRHSTVPSFFAKSTGSAQTYELAYNGTDYSVTLTDTNGVLANYSFTSSTAGVSFSVSGNQLTIRMADAPTGSVSITAEKKNAQRKGVITWTDGVASNNLSGHIQDLITYAESVSDPVYGYLNIKASYGNAKIIKTSEDGKVDGISFTISGNGVNKTVTTNANGEVQIDNLVAGVYTVTELTPDKYEPQSVQRVTVVSGKTATVTFNNVLKRGSLQVTKTSEDGLVEGMKFHLYGTSLSGLAVDEYAVTDKNGVAKFENVLIGTDYVLEEVDTPIRYVIPDSQSAAVEWNKVTNRSVHNILKKWNVVVTKSDVETGAPQGDASLAGAVYGIYKGDQLVDTYTTDANGQFTSNYYICGDDWNLREITPSEGYLLDTAVHHIGAEAKLYTVEYNTTANDVTEQVIKGNIAIIKHTDDGSTQIETPEEGAQFEVYLKSAGSYDNAKATERDILICDEHGFAQTKDMPYGVYTVRQTSGWEGRELMPAFDAYIAKDGETYRYLINNANFESYIKIVKVDAETGKTIPYAGAGFQLFRPDGTQITQSFTYPTPTSIDTFYTNDEGYLFTPEKQEYGKGYYLVEVFAPYGYVLNTDPVYFDVTQENSGEENGVTVIEVVKPNMAQKGIIHVSKSGEAFSAVREGKDGMYRPVFAVGGLENAVYEITAAEDIYTLDGTLRYAKGEVVDTVTTDADGNAASKPLYLGKYEVREITAPYGMVLNDEIHEVELVYAGQEVEITETATSFYNERQRVEISLDKLLEQDEKFGIGMNGEMSAVAFGLYAAEDMTAADGSVIPADGLIEIVTFDENGHGVCQSDLPLGSYYFKELFTDEHYLVSEEKYPVVFEYAGQDTALVKITAGGREAIENKLIRGEIKGLKTDEDGEALGGAVIGLFTLDCTDFTAENAILTATSAEDGSFSFADVPYGNWIVREITAPTGYVLSDESYPADINEDGAVIKISIENKLLQGHIRLTKVDKDYPDNKLSGAVFEVYADSNGNREFDKDDALLGTMTEQDGGVYEMLYLKYGGYFVKEKSAPEGFILDENAYYVSIEEHDKTYEVENEAGKGFINESQKGTLKIVKTSSDGKVEGFSFRVTGANGYEQIFKTDANGEILIENLRIGDYTVSEVSDSVSSGYILPADKQARIFEGKTTVVTMHNELRDTPKTGDDSNPALWFALLGISAAGAAVCGVLGLKKRKKEDAE